MVITSDKVGMSSGRDYSRNVTQSYKTSSKTSNSLFASITAQTLEDNYSSKEQYDSFTSSADKNRDFTGKDCNGKDNSTENPTNADNFNPMYYLQGSFIYTNMQASSFQAGGTEITSNESNVVNYPTATISSTSSTQNTSSVANTFADFKREAFYSLLDLIRNFKLRSLFEMDGSSQSSTIDSSESANISFASTSANIADFYSTSGAMVMTSSGYAMNWSVETSFSTIFTEKEATTFSTTGTVATADGRSIDFNMNLEMSREYMEQNDLTYLKNYSSLLTDPLVINLTDAPASISDQTFLFDIDGDGKQEEHASLGAGSGFLALDKNNDGIINDGTELFGTKSGNGFADLAEYDKDGNGWIDEADDIYKDLKVWTKDEDGKDKLLSLKDADVGAIYLGSSKTDFSMKDDTNVTKAQVRNTGFYLHEDGIAGSVQQIDL